MTNTEYNKFREHILDHMESIERLREELSNYEKLSSDGTLWNAIDTMCQNGCFDVYYSDCFETLKDVYSDKFDGSKYITKDGHWRWKNNNTYIWTVYKAKITKTIEIMRKKGEI